MALAKDYLVKYRPPGARRWYSAERFATERVALGFIEKNAPYNPGWDWRVVRARASDVTGCRVTA